MNHCRTYATHLLETVSLLGILFTLVLGAGRRCLDYTQLCLSLLAGSMTVSHAAYVGEGWRWPLGAALFVFCSECLCFTMRIDEGVFLLLAMSAELPVSMRYSFRFQGHAVSAQLPVNVVTILVSMLSLSVVSFGGSAAASSALCVLSLALYAAISLINFFPERVGGLLRRRARDSRGDCCVGSRGETPQSPDGMMESLFRKVKSVMEEDRPYLREDFSLYELSATVFTNKTYLSRTINAMTGNNFRQFVNGYRVRYSIGLMEANPQSKVNELAFQSGFHSTVTFNMAFKLNTGMTPGEYIQRIRLRGLSSRDQVQRFPEESS